MSNNRFINRCLQHPYYPWLVWGLAASAFFIEYFVRVAPGVMVDSLMHDFKVQALALGSLSAFFYYTYVGMQIPVGILVDRFSLRWLLTSMIFLCGLSSLIFAMTTHLEIAAFARLMMGFGAAFAFVSALKVAAVWFPAPHPAALRPLAAPAPVSSPQGASSVSRVGCGAAAQVCQPLRAPLRASAHLKLRRRRLGHDVGVLSRSAG